MLRKVTSGLREGIILRDRPYMEKRYFNVPSNVKRMNRYTFCGLLIDVPQMASHEQLYAGDVTTASDLIRIKYRVKFNEFNDNFNQDP